MGLADRGGSSGIVGRRWADICAEFALSLVGAPAQVPDDAGPPFGIDRVARLDDIPRIAAVASRKGLQNPDLLFLGSREGRFCVQAADAKFSIETARSKQVSVAVVEALLGLASLLRPLIGDLGDEPDILPGLFLSPDYPLTHAMLQGRPGILRATATPGEVILIPTGGGAFFQEVESAALIPLLAGLDDLPVDLDESLLASLYYFRVGRGVVGCWLDSVKPLLSMNDPAVYDEADVVSQLTQRLAAASGAFDLLLTWNADVETVRAQRAAVDHATGLPVMSKDLRGWISECTKGIEGEPPSMNQIRRRLGAWFRGQLRAEFGPLAPPVPDLPEKLRQLGVFGATLAPQLRTETERIVAELLAKRSESDQDDDVAELANG